MLNNVENYPRGPHLLGFFIGALLCRCLTPLLVPLRGDTFLPTFLAAAIADHPLSLYAK
jgi:hypothetical protein